MTEYSTLNNFQLYKKIRSIIINDTLYHYNRERYLEKLYRECHKRHPLIYDRAVNDALIMLDGMLFFDEERQIESIETVEAYTDKNGALVAAAGRDVLVNGATLEDLVKTKFFKIKVVGDSMIDVGIQPNCWVLVEPTTEYSDLDVCLVNLEGEQIIKTVSHADGKTWLYSENKKYQPMPLEEYFQWQVQGVVRDILMPLPSRYERIVNSNFV